jgi:hypothetical protein
MTHYMSRKGKVFKDNLGKLWRLGENLQLEAEFEERIELEKVGEFVPLDIVDEKINRRNHVVLVKWMGHEKPSWEILPRKRCYLRKLYLRFKNSRKLLQISTEECATVLCDLFLSSVTTI